LSSHFGHFKIGEFGRKQIRSFVINWYSAIADYSDKLGDSSLVKAEELLSSIDKNSSVLRIAKNPLLIRLVAAA
jgi:hypothetical protein